MSVAEGKPFEKERREMITRENLLAWAYDRKQAQKKAAKNAEREFRAELAALEAKIDKAIQEAVLKGERSCELSIRNSPLTYDVMEPLLKRYEAIGIDAEFRPYFNELWLKWEPL